MPTAATIGRGALLIAGLAIVASAALHGFVNVPHLLEHLAGMGAYRSLVNAMLVVLYFSVVAMFAFGVLVLDGAVRSLRGGRPQQASLWTIAATFTVFGAAGYLAVAPSPHMLGYAAMGLLVATGATLCRGRLHDSATRGGRACVLLALAGAAAPVSAQAQTPEQPMVPLELVQTLVGGVLAPGALPEVLVGRLPDGMAQLVALPDGSRVVGSLVQSHASIGVVAEPGTPSAVREAWTARLLAAGWTRFQPPQRGGFEPNWDPGLQFCMGESQSLSLSVTANPYGGSYVRVMHPRGQEFSVCRSPPRPEYPGMRESLIPSLASPAGARTRGSGSGGGGGEWQATARIDTELSVAQLADHYDAQLREHGWTPAERMTSGDAVVATYRVTDRDGAAWYGVLLALGPEPEADRLLTLRVIRVEREY